MITVLDRMVRWFLLFLIAFMILTVTWQVLSRYVAHASSSVTEEIARFQLIWLGLAGAVYTFRNRMHVGIDILTAGLTGKWRVAAEMGSLVACAVFAALILVYGGARLVLQVATLNQTSAAMGIPMAWVYTIVPISGVLILIYATHFIRLTLRGHVEAPHDVDGPRSGELPLGGSQAPAARSGTTAGVGGDEGA